MTSYSVGFAFSPDLREIMLIEKKRPPWQAGLLNGVGGKIEDEETPLKAMVREFEEEAGILTHDNEWVHFATLSTKRGHTVHFFYHVFVGCMPPAVSPTDEIITICPLGDPYSNWVPNLRYLIPMAINHINHEDDTEMFDIFELPKMMGT